MFSPLSLSLSRRRRLRRLTSVWNSGWRRKELTTKMRSDQFAEMTNELAPRRGRWGKTERRPGEQWGLAEGRTARPGRPGRRDNSFQSMIQKQVFRPGYRRAANDATNFFCGS